ncbi:hypothetical protein KPL47_12725 [Clostridium estertheticum]|uniref:hypothetical protein n=1 Tax=Clostridium estertheticum TaxID=238834 RepID=UPI001C0CE6BB|nr:hypothetical protein [Clostridium estertheticum]MBU3177213.1 hypothetical protein [Clostridium estertheticum]
MKILKREMAGIIVLLSVLFNTTIAFAAAPFNQTVEGNSNYFVTGESFASNIQLAGYNSRDKAFYTNFNAQTTKPVAVGSVATFNYEISVFDGTSISLGNLGSYAIPQTIIAAAGSQSVQANNKIVTLSSPLTAQFVAVVTIDSVTITP